MIKRFVLPVLLFAVVILHGLNAVTQSAGKSKVSTPNFVPAPNSPIHTGPMTGRPEIGDCNGDRIPDIVVACGTCCGDHADPHSGHLMVLLGDGRGSFKPADGSPMKIGSSVRKVALGDVNRDGKLDAVAAEHDTYSLTVLLGDGGGRFLPASGSPVLTSNGSRPHTHEVALSDINQDGLLDVMTTNVNDSTLSVLLGDGNGKFAAAQGSPIPVARGPYDSLVLRDFDGDKKLDVAMPNIHGNKLEVLRGDGRGGFARFPGSPYAVNARPIYAASTDVNNDGKPDLLATHDDVNLLTILLNDGKGGFSPAAGAPMKTPGIGLGIAAADLNGDGNIDLAFGAMSGMNSPARPFILLGDGKAGFTELKGLELDARRRPEYLALADLNRDGRLDMVVSNYGSGSISVLLGQKQPK
jgi:hypothetical protein